MRTFFLLAAASCFSIAGISQETVSAFHYEVDGAIYYQVKGGLPQSAVAFYSERHGGKMLKEEKLDGAGMLTISADKGFNPAFIVDRGTGKVLFLEEREFSLSDMQPEHKGNAASLSWTAATDPAKNISFEILRSIDGEKYEAVAEVIAYSSGLSSPYTYTDEAGSAAHSYKIRVKNAKAGERYTSGPMAMTGKNLRIYPTVTSSEINIDLLQDASSAQYLVTNTLGQPVLSGELYTGKNVCRLDGLAPGIYLVTVTAPGLNTSVKLVKE
jgi:hypothetical protein